MSTHRRLLASAATAFVAVALTACDPQQAGAAAVVAGNRIPESRVNAAAVEALEAAAGSEDPAGGLDQDVFMRENTNRLVTSALLARAAADEGVVVTPAEVDALLEQAAGGQPREVLESAVAAQAAVPPSELESFARDFLLRTKLGQTLAPTGDANAQQAAVQARLAEEAAEAGVTISPRYGTWDPATATIGGPVDDLSVLPAEPSGSPEPLEQP